MFMLTDVLAKMEVVVVRAPDQDLGALVLFPEEEAIQNLYIAVRSGMTGNVW